MCRFACTRTLRRTRQPYTSAAITTSTTTITDITTTSITTITINTIITTVTTTFCLGVHTQLTKNSSTIHILSSLLWSLDGRCAALDFCLPYFYYFASHSRDNTRYKVHKPH